MHRVRARPAYCGAFAFYNEFQADGDLKQNRLRLQEHVSRTLQFGAINTLLLEPRMKSILAALAMTTALSVPGLAMARPVTLTATLNNYGGNGAYLALYVTDAAGAYKGTLWLAGSKSKYYSHLSGWQRGSGGNLSDINGITGASVGAGRTLKVTLDLADALFDAGYKLHFDAAAEDMRDSPSEVIVPLTSVGAGRPVAGRSYIRSVTYDM
jgi:hypothetical protein